MIIHKYEYFFLMINTISLSVAISQRSFSTELLYGFIIPHSIEVQNTAGSFPRGFSFQFNKVDTSYIIYKQCNCHVQHSASLSFFDYHNYILGHSIGINYVFTPLFRIHSRYYIPVKGILGLVYQNNPYHPVRNPTNMSYSSFISFQVGLGSGLYTEVNERWFLGVYGYFLHTSNGGLRDPNKGINWPSFSIEIGRKIHSYIIPSHALTQKEGTKKITMLTLGAFYSSRIIQKGDKKRYSLGGLNIEYLRKTSLVNGWIFGIEGYEDYSLKEMYRRIGDTESRSMRAGLYGGHSFWLGRFIFSQMIGIYGLYPYKYFDLVYHRWSLIYLINKKWIMGFSLKAHRHIANFADVRVAYNFF